MKNKLHSSFRKLKGLFFSKPVLLFCLSLLLFAAGIFYYAKESNFYNNFPPPTLSPLAETEESLEADKGILGWNAYQEPNIYLSGGENGYTAGGMIALASTDEPAVVISGQQISGGQAEIAVYEASEVDLLNYLIHDKDGKQRQTVVDSSKMRFVTNVNHSIDTSSYSGSKIPLPLKETGIWYLKVKVNSVSADAYVLRSNVGVIAKEEDNHLVYWGQDFRTKRSVPDGTIKLMDLQDSAKQLSMVSFTAEGIAKSPISGQADIALVNRNNDVAIIPLNLKYLNGYYSSYKQFQEKSRLTRYFIFTDRPIYKPGDTINFKTILRDDDDARYTIPQGEAVVKIYNGSSGENDKPVFEKSYPISADGTINGQYKLAEDEASVGYYTLSVELPNQKPSNGYFSYSEYSSNTTSFDVQHYRKPEFSIDVSTSRSIVTAGDQASFTISGNYFSGQPMISQKVKYTVYAADFYEYQYLSDRDAYSSEVNDDYRYGYWYGDKNVTSGEAVLDTNGEAIIDLDTQMDFNEGRSQVFSIEATIEDGSVDPAFSRKNMVVFAGEFGIFRKDQSYGSRVNTPLSLPLILKGDAVNAKVSNIQLTAKVKRTNWISFQETNKKFPSYREEKEDLPDIKATTDSQGNATLNMIPNKIGSYTFTVQGQDSRGNLISKVFYSYITEIDQAYYTDGGNNELTISTDKQKYGPKDTVRFNIFSQIPDRDVFLSLERGKVNRYQVVRLNGKSGTVDVPLVNTDVPNIFAQVSSFSNSTLDTNQTNIEVSSEGKKIVVKVTPDSKTYGPGETVQANILTTDTAGNPVSSELALWSVDKAIFELTENRLGNIFKTFWFERYDSTQEAHSLEGIVVKQAEGGGGCFAPDTQVLMFDGRTKNIQDVKAGEFVLTRSEKDPSLVKARVSSTHEIEVAGYMILNGNLRVTAEHIMWINNQWKEAGSAQIGDEFTGRDGKQVIISSVEWVAGKFKVHNLEIENYHTYFAGGVWVHNQKGVARSTFKDTSYWNPSIKTDFNGRAQVSFKLPDNLTTWVIAAVASTSDTRVGQTTEEIIVTKDVVVRPILPNIMRTGDEIIVSALVQNFTDQDQTFDTNLKFDAGEVEGADQNDLIIKSKATRQLYWKIKPNTETPKSKLIFSAKVKSNDKLADILTREVPVRPFGFEEKTAVSVEGTKELPVKLAADINKGKTSVTLSLSPTILGALPSAMKYLIDYPYGCVEQTTSRFVPAVIAKVNSTYFAESLKDKNLDEIIDKGVARLAALQQSDGGWSWWSSGKSDPYITAYVVEYLVLAKNSGVKIEDYILNNAKYFLNQEKTYDSQGNPALPSTREELIAKSYGLAMLGEVKPGNVVTYDGLSSDLLAMAVIVNYKSGMTDPQANGLNKLISMAKTQGDAIFWEAGNKLNFGSDDASTAFAIRAILIAGGDREIAVKGARYLTRSRKFDYWSNTYATAQVIRSLVELSKTGEELTPNYSYAVAVDGKQIAQGVVSNSKQIIKDIVVPVESIKDGGSKISVTKNGDGQIYSTLLLSQFHTDRNARAVNNGLSVSREYINEKGEEYSLGVGDTAIVKITVKGLNAQENYGVIKDELPSGLVPINENFKNEQYGNSPMWYYTSYDVSDREITENGMVLSLYRMPKGERTYTYKARVVNEGKFIVPPTTASLMYSPEVNGRTEAQTVVIEKESRFVAKKALPKILSKNLNAISVIRVLVVLIIVGVGVLILRRRGVTFSSIKARIFKKNNSQPPVPPPSAPPAS